MLVDVSVLARDDAGTGIQRVTKALLHELIAAPPEGYVVRTVRASRWRSYRYSGEPGNRAEVRVQSGDLFLGLDFASRILPHHQLQLLRWRAAGTKICIVMYDMLPLLRPDWFTRGNTNAYRAWIRTVAIHADFVACISQCVAGQFRAWLSEQAFDPLSLNVGWFHLGTPLPSAEPLLLLDRRLRNIFARPFLLMVGTIEPRKGYAQVLEAFDALWRDGHPMQLVIVGRRGWKVDALLQKLRRHREAGHRLHWLDDADDQLLHALYASAHGVLIASEAEGFGLPILEAAAHGAPLLLRDLPVFREIAGTAASYFTARTPAQLADEINRWIQHLSAGDATAPVTLARQTWAQSARQLLTQLPLKTSNLTGKCT